jgi:two-component system response regulator AtoC
MKKPLAGLTPSAERVLLNARWDGNVREVKNVIERACLLAEGTLISERELSGPLGAEVPIRRRPDPAPHRQSHPPAALRALEREHIIDVLKQVGGNRMAAAKLLGISRRALYRRLERHRIAEETASLRAH